MSFYLPSLYILPTCLSTFPPYMPYRQTPSWASSRIRHVPTAILCPNLHWTPFFVIFCLFVLVSVEGDHRRVGYIVRRRCPPRPWRRTPTQRRVATKTNPQQNSTHPVDCRTKGRAMAVPNEALAVPQAKANFPRLPLPLPLPPPPPPPPPPPLPTLVLLYRHP